MHKMKLLDFPIYNGEVSSFIPVWKDSFIKDTIKTPLFDVKTIHRNHPDGVREGDFVQIKSREWVNIIPLVIAEDGERFFIVERQFRHGSCEVTLEFPAGIVEYGEDPKFSALRELKEETGLIANKITLMGRINPNPAFMSVMGNYFLAEDLYYTGERELDQNEEIEVMLLSEKKAFSLMSAEHNTNGSMLISLFYYLKYNNRL